MCVLCKGVLEVLASVCAMQWHLGGIGMFFERILKFVRAMRRRLGGLGVYACYAMASWRSWCVF